MHGAIIKVCHETETLEFTISMHMHQNGKLDVVLEVDSLDLY
jgi:hypothetical protein